MSIEFIMMLWWTMTVVLLMSVLDEFMGSNRDTVLAIAGCLSWPFLLPFVFIMLLYDMLIKSTKKLRIDIANRGLMKEFEEFIKLRNHGKILPKGDY